MSNRLSAWLLAATAIILATEVVRAEPRNDTEAEGPNVVVVFSGHTQSLRCYSNHQGAKSASGTREFQFNDQVVSLFDKKSNQGIVYKPIPASLNIPFQSRPALAAKLDASAIIEIHHDSVQRHIYKRLVKARPGNPMLDYYRGFSLLVYPKSQSIKLAKAIERRMIAAKLKWSEYHTENIPGERMRLIKGTRAIYERGKLFILRASRVPTVIIECGCIANPEEERLLKKRSHVVKIVNSVHAGIVDFFEGVDGPRKRLSPTEARRLQQPSAAASPNQVERRRKHGTGKTDRKNQPGH